MTKSTFIRSAEFELRDDGRTLTGCIVPYNQIATVVDIDEETQSVVKYREKFLPHSLAAMAQGFKARGGTSQRSNMFVPLVLDHQDSFGSRIGFCTELEDLGEGAFASFRLYDDANMQKIRSVLTESHKGFSIMFKDIREPRMIDDVVCRVQVQLGHVAATPMPAYVGASIQSLRNSDDEMVADRPLLNGVREWLQSQRELMGANSE